MASTRSQAPAPYRLDEPVRDPNYVALETSRLIYRPRRHPKHRGKGRNSFAWSDYRDLVVRRHIQLGTPIVLIWDNLNTHRTAGMREYAASHDWLTIGQLCAYAPDLNPVEDIWSPLRRGRLANVAFTDDEHLERNSPPRPAPYPTTARPHRGLPCRHWTAPHPPPDNNPRRSVSKKPGSSRSEWSPPHTVSSSSANDQSDKSWTILGEHYGACALRVKEADPFEKQPGGIPLGDGQPDVCLASLCGMCESPLHQHGAQTRVLGRRIAEQIGKPGPSARWSPVMAVNRDGCYDPHPLQHHRTAVQEDAVARTVEKSL